MKAVLQRVSRASVTVAGEVVGQIGRGIRVETGIFRAMMEVELVNDGPVTLLLDSRKRF